MKIAFLGDIGLFGKFDVSSGFDYQNYFSKVSPLLQGMDLVVGNLETPFAEGFKVKGAKSAYIGAKKESVAILKHLNVGCVNLANNHTGDYGLSGYNLTKEILKNNNIEYFGIEDKQFRFHKDETRIAFSGFCNFDTNPCFTNFGGDRGVDTVNFDRVLKVLRKNHQEGWLNVLSFHSGLEHVNYPSVEDIKFAREVSKLLPFVYCGHHPHVVQGVERTSNSVIFYSLGNFCFDDVYIEGQASPLIKMSENNRTGMIAVVTLEGNQVISHECIPIYIGSDKMLVGDEVQTFPIEKYSSVLPRIDFKEYNAFRNSLLDQHYKTRVVLRDWSWYVKRLRPRYFRMIVNARRNAMLYRENFSNYLDS